MAENQWTQGSAKRIRRLAEDAARMPRESDHPPPGQNQGFHLVAECETNLRISVITQNNCHG